MYWLDDAEVIGTPSEQCRGSSCGFFEKIFSKIGRSEKSNFSTKQALPFAWELAQPAESADTDALVIGIENLAGVSVGREQLLRRKLWWRFNQQHRYPVETAIGMSETIRRAHEQSNLHRLLDLSAGDEDRQCLERAEILRELGRFEEAREALALIREKNAGVEILASKIGAKDSKVCITHQNSW